MVCALVPASTVHAEEHPSYWAQDSGRHETMSLRAYEDQAGEGLTVFAESEKGANAVYIPSNRIVVSTLFSTGVGPAYEDDTDGMPGFPYRGKVGITEITELDALTQSKYRQAVKKSRKEAPFLPQNAFWVRYSEAKGKPGAWRTRLAQRGVSPLG